MMTFFVRSFQTKKELFSDRNNEPFVLGRKPSGQWVALYGYKTVPVQTNNIIASYNESVENGTFVEVDAAFVKDKLPLVE